MDVSADRLGWQPANDVERALRDAMARGAVDDYRGVLGSATLTLPLRPGATRADPSVQPWATGHADGRTFIIAFTSLDAMQRAVGADTATARELPFPDVAETWPDPGVWLAVNLGTPVQALFDAEAVARTAWLGERAAYPVDAALRAAVRAGDETAYALGLLAADLVLPVSPEAPPSAIPGDADFAWWRSSTADGAPVIVAYSSRQRLRADLGDVAHTVVDMPEVLAGWPDRTTALAVNPGMPIAGLISGPAMVGIADWVAGVSHAAQDAAAAAGSDATMSEYDRDLAAYQAARDTVTALLRG